uniref:Transmembrane protein n=1 Tax=Octopus bimaculoides TaxID=37653 RepID=A0A0L8FM48_OCTBM
MQSKRKEWPNLMDLAKKPQKTLHVLRNCTGDLFYPGKHRKRNEMVLTVVVVVAMMTLILN